MIDHQFQPVFSGSTLDRLDHVRHDENAIKKLLGARETRFLAFRNLSPLMRTKPDLEVRYFCSHELPSEVISIGRCILLGADDVGPVFAIALDTMDESGFSELMGDAIKAIDLRSIAIQFGSFEKDAGRCALLAQGKALLDWHARHQFCSVCGSDTEMTRGGAQRKCQSHTCGAEHFPRVDPVVIMLVIDGDECLLGRSRYFTPNVYSALAGFMEVGETLEEAVARELKEEVGIDISAVHYFRSQPWPFPSSLMIGVFAKAASKEITIDTKEIEDARWFTKAEISAMIKGDKETEYMAPTTIAIARLLLEAWIAGRAQI